MRPNLPLGRLNSITLAGVSTKKRLVPTKLKKLAETRARLSGLLDVRGPLNQAYLDEVSVLNEKLRVATSVFEKSDQQLTHLKADLAKVDEAIAAIAPTVKPASIKPIRAWSGQYGRRGALRDFLLEALTVRYPEFLSTPDLANLTITAFSLTFESKREPRAWYDNSLETH